MLTLRARTAAGLLLLGLALLIAAASPASAPAASCAAGGCTNQDPYTTGCNAGDAVAGSGPILDGSGNRIGEIRLFWSSACQSNWGQVYFDDGNPPSTPPVTIKVTGSTSGSAYDNGPVSYTYTGSGSPVWGNMAYSPGCAYATVTRGSAHGTAVQTGCAAPGGGGGGPPPPGKCSGISCTGQDPVASACARDATTVGSAPIVNVAGRTIGTLELRWSTTCETNWGRASFDDGNPPDTPPVDIQVVGSSSDSATYDEAPVDFPSTGSGSPMWGNMAYSPGCAYASVSRGDANAIAVQSGCPSPSSAAPPNTPYQLTANGYDWTVPGGQDLNGDVADFTDPDPNGSTSDFIATIDWGDGTTSGGTIVNSTSGFSVLGDHHYPDPTVAGVATANSYQVNVTITDTGGGADGGGGSTSAQTFVTVVGNDQPANPPDGSAPGMSTADKILTAGYHGAETTLEGIACASGDVDLIGLLACPFAGAGAVETGAALADPPDPRYRHVFRAKPLRVSPLHRHCFRLSRARCATLYRAELAYRRASLKVLTLLEDIGVTANRFGGAARARSRRYETLQRNAQKHNFALLRAALAQRRRAGRALGALLQRYHLDRRLSAQQIERGRQRMLSLSGLSAAEQRRLRADGLPSTRGALRRIVRHALRSAPHPADTLLSSALGL